MRADPASSTLFRVVVTETYAGAPYPYGDTLLGPYIRKADATKAANTARRRALTGHVVSTDIESTSTDWSEVTS